MQDVQDVLNILNNKTKVVLPLLLKWQGIYYGMSLHTTGAVPKFKDARTKRWITPTNFYGERYQWIFDNILLNQHPREAESTRHWRMSQYRPYTQAPFRQIIEVVTGAIFQDSNYTLEVDDKKDSDYIWGNNFEGKDLIHYFESKLETICEDPNGFFVYIPTVSRKETGDRVEPAIWFVNTKDIIFHSEHELVFLRQEMAWHINKVGIFRYKKDQTGSYVNVDGEDGYYAHLLGYIPADYAGGIWNTQGFFDSWLSKAKAVADDMIGSISNEQLVNKEASHPFIIAASADCPSCDNHCGKVTERCPNWINQDEPHECNSCTDGWWTHNCGACGGSGQVPYSPGKWMEAPPDNMDKQLIQIVNPDVAINQFHFDKNKELYKMLSEALFLYRSEKAESGAAKAIDQENKYQFISKISNDMFDRLIHNAVKTITSYRNIITDNGDTKPQPVNFAIIKPTQFQIKTADDLLEEYKTGTEAMLPAFTRSQLAIDYIDKQYGGDDIMKKKGDFISQDDPIFVYSIADKKALVGSAIDNRQLQYSIHLPQILDQIVREKDKSWFIKADFAAIKIEVDKIFGKIAEIKAADPTQITKTVI